MIDETSGFEWSGQRHQSRSGRDRKDINDFIHVEVSGSLVLPSSCPSLSWPTRASPLGGANPLDLLISPVSLGIVAGLLIGKQLGVTLASFLTVKLGLAELPDGIAWKHISGASWLGAIGFTMSLFVASLAFRNSDLLAQAKLASLFTSLIAGLGGYLVLRLASRQSATDDQ